MYDNAIVGSAAGSDIATSKDNSSNSASKGGGICLCNSSKLYLGYDSKDLNQTYGVLYNWAETNGGGIYCSNSSVYLNSGSVSNNGTSSSSKGGGLCGDTGGGSSTIIITGGTVSNNKALYGGAAFHQRGTFEITGGTISGNVLYSGGLGSGICAAANIKFGNDALVSSDNDVYLDCIKSNGNITSYCMIEDSSSLTNNQVATITPYEYDTSVQFMNTNAAALYASKFNVTPDGGTSYKITSGGYLQQQ